MSPENFSHFTMMSEDDRSLVRHHSQTSPYNIEQIVNAHLYGINSGCTSEYTFKVIDQAIKTGASVQIIIDTHRQLINMYNQDMNQPMNKHAKRINEYLRQEIEALEITAPAYKDIQKQFIEGLREARRIVQEKNYWFFPTFRHQLRLSRALGKAKMAGDQTRARAIEAAIFKVDQKNES